MNEADALERRNQALNSAACFIRGYSAMLLYTGSCPRTIYHQVIRPSMALIHPGFSGAWARDYRFVRGVLHGRVPFPRNADSPALLEEQRLNALIHDGTAAKLVPSGSSLLKTFTTGNRLSPSAALRVLYDSYFLTVRDRVPYDLIIRQFLRRLDAIAQDLTTNGLYPDFASSEPEKDPRLREPPVLICERDIPQLLSQLADHAVGLRGGCNEVR